VNCDRSISSELTPQQEDKKLTAIAPPGVVAPNLPYEGGLEPSPISEETLNVHGEEQTAGDCAASRENVELGKERLSSTLRISEHEK
jgi:hypothetical protein